MVGSKRKPGQQQVVLTHNLKRAQITLRLLKKIQIHTQKKKKKKKKTQTNTPTFTTIILKRAFKPHIPKVYILCVFRIFQMSIFSP